MLRSLNTIPCENLSGAVSARRQLNELSDEMATKLTVLYYTDAREALIKALGEF